MTDYGRDAQPRPKNAMMEALAEAMATQLKKDGQYQHTRKEAREQRVCICCGRKIDGTNIIRTQVEADEWGLSFLCGECWDRTMGKF